MSPLEASIPVEFALIV